jgi:hypothetical protein
MFDCFCSFFNLPLKNVNYTLYKIILYFNFIFFNLLYNNLQISKKELFKINDKPN